MHGASSLAWEPIPILSMVVLVVGPVVAWMFAFVYFARTQFRDRWAAVAPAVLLFATTAMMWVSADALRKADDGLWGLFYIYGMGVTWAIVLGLAMFGESSGNRPRKRVIPPRPDR